MAVVLMQLLEVIPAEFVNSADPYGWYPLHKLGNNRDKHGVRFGMIRTLCEAAALVDVEKKRGRTPLMSAVNTEFEEAADELMLQGADVYRTNDEGVSIYDAAWHREKTRRLVRKLGAGKCAGVSGEGRLLPDPRR